MRRLASPYPSASRPLHGDFPGGTCSRASQSQGERPAVIGHRRKVTLLVAERFWAVTSLARYAVIKGSLSFVHSSTTTSSFVVCVHCSLAPCSSHHSRAVGLVLFLLRILHFCLSRSVTRPSTNVHVAEPQPQGGASPFLLYAPPRSLNRRQ